MVPRYIGDGFISVKEYSAWVREMELPGSPDGGDGETTEDEVHEEAGDLGQGAREGTEEAELPTDVEGPAPPPDTEEAEDVPAEAAPATAMTAPVTAEDNAPPPTEMIGDGGS